MGLKGQILSCTCIGQLTSKLDGMQWCHGLDGVGGPLGGGTQGLRTFSYTHVSRQQRVRDTGFRTKRAASLSLSIGFCDMGLQRHRTLGVFSVSAVRHLA